MYSVVHHHVLAAINSEVEAGKKEISILDAGCGNCMMISLIHKKLRELRPSMALNIYGFDVNDSQVQQSDYFEKSIRFLNQEIPDGQWADKLKMIGSEEPWPYGAGTFDFVISNQVLEHVVDHDHFFGEMNRVLKVGGKGIHVFPLRHYIYEGHLHLPFAHRIKNWDYLYLYIKFCSRIGIGKYKGFKKNNPGLAVEDFSKSHTDYMIHNTHYISKPEIYGLTKKHHFRSSFRYSGWLYINKIRTLLKMPLIYRYRPNKHIWVGYFIEMILIRLSSITMFLEKKNVYR